VKTDVTVEVITEHECESLLAATHLGRLGFTARSLPVVLPVNYVLDGRTIVFRSESESILAACTAGQVACLEVDDHDLLAHTGWSVLATGRLREEKDPDRAAALAHLALPAWRPMTAPHLLTLGVELISGRRIHPPRW
jgi:nitroimidazol reductase NimA-like FMN-containing flavoprotein (pyridoxamine 5'-phosphate oxidase superfamily)